jgi:hypothetical protein
LHGLDVHIGERLPGFLEQFGLADIRVRRRTFVWRAGDLKYRFLEAILNRVRSEIVDRQLLTESELERLERDFAILLNEPELRILSPTYVQVWGRKPELSTASRRNPELVSRRVQPGQRFWQRRRQEATATRPPTS